MSEQFTNNLNSMVELLKQLKYTYKDGKIFNAHGSLASYPVLNSKTDAVRVLIEKDNNIVAVEAPLEPLILAWHGKPVKEEEYPINIDGDDANTRVDNLVYLTNGEKAEASKYEPRTEAELKAVLYLMGVHPDEPKEDFSAAKLLSEIATLKKDRASIPLGAVPCMYGDFVFSRMNKALTVKDALVNYSMGLAGEAGETANLIKKHRFHGHAMDVAELVEELGDVMFYVQALCNILDIDIIEVMLHNARKLSIRYPKAFSSKESIERKDVKE